MIKKLFVALVSVSSCFGASWQEILDERGDLLPAGSLVLEQFKAFSLSEAPTLADERIKAISIVENGEGVVDLRKIENGRIEMMPEPSYPFESPHSNSGLPNASKMRKEVYAHFQKMVAALDELAASFGYEPGQVSIRVFEGVRDLENQKMLFHKKLDEIVAAHPEMTPEEAEKETSKWLSPYKNNVPGHSTGGAVDIRLWDSKKEDFLDLGPFGVIWGNNPFSPTFSEGLSDEQKENRLFCLLAAEKAGLVNYVYEFWHFSSGDRYAEYWTVKDPNEKQAVYGPIQTLVSE